MHESGYIFDGVKGDIIFIFLSRRLSFFSKPDFCAIRTQMTTKSLKLSPQNPTMVVWNHMNESMISKDPFGDAVRTFFLYISSAVGTQNSAQHRNFLKHFFSVY